MSSTKHAKGNIEVVKHKKKTRIGRSTNTKWKQPGPNGGNKGYRKKYRGQGKR